jgi:type IV pilus assembly protein PilB
MYKKRKNSSLLTLHLSPSCVTISDIMSDAAPQTISAAQAAAKSVEEQLGAELAAPDTPITSRGEPLLDPTGAPFSPAPPTASGTQTSGLKIPPLEGISAQSTPKVDPPVAEPAADVATPPATPIDPLGRDPQPLGAVPDAQLPAAPVPQVQAPQLPSSILDILVQQNSLTRQQADDLILEQASTGRPIESLVQEKNLVSEANLTRARAQFYNIPFIEIVDIAVSPEAISLIPESVARRYHMLPFALNKQEHLLSVVMVNPLDLSAIDFVEKQTGYHLQPHYTPPGEIERLIAERYSQNLSGEVTEALKETKFGNTQNRLEDLSSLSKEVVREAPINKIVETILAYAMKSRASDVHIEPQEDRTRVRYRIDGILTEKLILPRTVHEAVISRIKILADLKIDEKRLPQDGRFAFTSDGADVDLRVSTLPTIHGEKVVMRLLKKDASVPTLPDLGLRGKALRDVEDISKVPHGIILITGPTGSGKTTTLYSLLHQINTPKVNISTLEDPVEYEMPGINQVQINPQAGLTFASGLRSFLRQDPNIIMVGEIRDSETTELAIQASLTGHLVLSTLHTNSAAGALPRLVDMGAEPFLLASTLTLSVGQRVVRRLNPSYIEEYEPEAVVVEDIKKVLGPLFSVWCTQNKKDPEKITLFRAKEDRPNNEPEYLGRIAIFEVLRITELMSKMILESRSEAEIEKAAVEHGMLLMKQDGYMKALEGITTLEEVIRVAEI